jgi:dihydrofolate reductase
MAMTLDYFLASWDWTIFAIAAVDENGGLGLDGKLLVRNKADMSFFKQRTSGSTLLAGRKTADSLGDWRTRQVLPGRKLYVATEGAISEDGSPKGQCGRVSTNLSVIGGAEIYRQALPYCDHVLLTRHLGVHKADTWFPMDELDSLFRLDSTLYEGELTVQRWVKRKRSLTI